jgi:hypothetical protein
VAKSKDKDEDNGVYAEAARAERRLLRDEERSLRRLEKAQARLARAEEKLGKAQDRVHRRQSAVDVASDELTAAHQARADGPTDQASSEEAETPEPIPAVTIQTEAVEESAQPEDEPMPPPPDEPGE